MENKNNLEHKDASIPEGVIQVKLNWKKDLELDTIYINQMKITHTGPEFYLIFGELPMPAVIGDDKFPEELDIIPKVRLAIAPEMMLKISEAISENCRKYQEKIDGNSNAS